MDSLSYEIQIIICNYFLYNSEYKDFGKCQQKLLLDLMKNFKLNTNNILLGYYLEHDLDSAKELCEDSALEKCLDLCKPINANDFIKVSKQDNLNIFIGLYKLVLNLYSKKYIKYLWFNNYEQHKKYSGISHIQIREAVFNNIIRYLQKNKKNSFYFYKMLDYNKKYKFYYT